MVINSRYFPILTSENLSLGTEGECFRFLGTLEAIEGDEIIWLQGEDFRISVSMRGEEVYILTGHPLAQNNEPGQVLPQRMAWDQMQNLAEGTQFFVFGGLVQHGGRHIFASSPSQDLLVVVYDGDPEHFVSWAVWSGRQQNEFWNFLTPVALLIGSISYLLLTLYMAEYPIQRFWLAVGLVGALIPVLPLFPPGIGLYLLYRSKWRQGRKCRADRDVLALPLIYFLPPDVTSSEGGFRVVRHLHQHLGQALPRERLLPDGTVYTREQVTREEVDKLGESGPILRENPRELETSRDDEYWGEMYSLAGRKKPSDPMAEYLAIPGDPLRSVIESQKGARKNERNAIILFSLALILNLPIVGWILWQTLRIIR